MKTVDVFQLTDNKFITNIMENNNDNGFIKVVLADKTVEMRMKLAIFHGIIWRPFIKFNVKPSTDDIYFKNDEVVDVTTKSISRIQTIQYKKLLDMFPNVHKMDIVEQLFLVIQDLWNFQFKYCRKYTQSMSAYKLYKLTRQKKIKDLVKLQFKENTNTNFAEKVLKEYNKRLINLLKTRGALEYNPLLTLMETGSLKSNQIPQIFIAYGCRSDIDNTMMSHIISNSNLQGLKSVEDFATEYLSTKKSNWMSKTSIRDTQYFARTLRLLTSCLKKIYPGDCGSVLTLPMKITKHNFKNFMNKDIIINNQRITLTKQNIKDFIDTVVYMKSPILCRYTDGICESCAGRDGGHILRFLPPNIHIGKYSATKKASKISQSILSTKHLLATDSIEYKPTKAVLKFFRIMVRENNEVTYGLKIREKLVKDKATFIIPRTAIVGILTDLTLDVLPLPAMFSHIDEVAIKYQNGVIIPIDMTTEDSKQCPFLSREFLMYMKSVFREIKETDDTIEIPLYKWNPNMPVFGYMTMNDDMYAYAKRIISFTKTELVNFHNLTDALTAYSNVVFEKINLNIFFLEVVLRCLMIKEPGVDYSIPVVENINDVYFSKIIDLMDGRDISTKLGYERINPYISNPKTYLLDKEDGLYDIFFGLY